MIGESWDGWRAATCMPDHCFCEAIRSGFVRQPANAVSSLAFAVVGILVLVTGYRDRHSAGSRNAVIEGLSGYALVFASALIVVGIGSAFYHASLSFIGQFADVMGMYLIATFVILYSFGRIAKLSTVAIVIGYVAANSALAWLLFTVPSMRRYTFAVVLLGGLGVELIARRWLHRRLNGGVLVSAVIALTIGFAVWILDITRTACSPNSFLQGHALWHIAGAFASWQLYLYYRSERGQRDPASP